MTRAPTKDITTGITLAMAQSAGRAHSTSRALNDSIPSRCGRNNRFSIEAEVYKPDTPDALCDKVVRKFPRRFRILWQFYCHFESLQELVC